jgi:hypothetical protein
VLFVLLIAVEAWQVWRQPELVERVGDVLTIAALAAAAYRLRPLPGPAARGSTSSVDFYRTLLERQRDQASHPWRYLVLFVPGVGLSLLGDAFDRSPAQTAAIIALGVGLFLGVAWLHTRTAHNLQRDIDALG